MAGYIFAATAYFLIDLFLFSVDAVAHISGNNSFQSHQPAYTDKIGHLWIMQQQMQGNNLQDIYNRSYIHLV